MPRPAKACGDCYYFTKDGLYKGPDCYGACKKYENSVHANEKGCDGWQTNDEYLIKRADKAVQKAHESITKNKVSRFTAVFALRQLAERVENLEMLKGFTIDWEIGKSVEIKEKILPPEPVEFVTFKITVESEN